VHVKSNNRKFSSIEIMELIELCGNLLMVLEQFDESILPLGLYSCDDLVTTKRKGFKQDFQEWYRAIAPYLQDRGYVTDYVRSINDYAYSSKLRLSNLGSVDFTIVKISKIKVRKYGSDYKVDIHEDRAQRWKDTNMRSHLRQLWKPTIAVDNPAIRIVVLIGFDKSPHPFRRELLELEDSLQLANRGVTHLSREWADKADRHFHIRLAAWASPLSINDRALLDILDFTPPDPQKP
jgi:hypothetical protein